MEGKIITTLLSVMGTHSHNDATQTYPWWLPTHVPVWQCRWMGGINKRQGVYSCSSRESTDRTMLCTLCHKALSQTCYRKGCSFWHIQLFNHDALYLCMLKFAIKNGDVGGVLNILMHWMIMFRGTGKMPKYADALFHVLINLKRMNPKLQWEGIP